MARIMSVTLRNYSSTGRQPISWLLLTKKGFRGNQLVVIIFSRILDLFNLVCQLIRGLFCRLDKFSDYDRQNMAIFIGLSVIWSVTATAYSVGFKFITK